jgi:hypothetical protein
MKNIGQAKRQGRLTTTLITNDILVSRLHFKNICALEDIFYIKMMIMSIFITSTSIHFNRCIALKCDSCVNKGESAAVFGFPLKKAVKIHPRVETAAAGLLFKKIPNNKQIYHRVHREHRENTDDRRQKTDDRGQMTDDRRRKTEDRRRKTDDRRRKTEDCRQSKEEKWHF